MNQDADAGHPCLHNRHHAVPHHLPPLLQGNNPHTILPSLTPERNPDLTATLSDSV